MKVTSSQFGKNSQLFRIENDNGYVLEATDFGARIVRLLVPTKTGQLKNISLGFASEEEYYQQGTYFGATIGRVAGRIAKGEFVTDQAKQQFNRNEGNNTLHGGNHSFEEKIWQTAVVEKADSVQLVFTHTSPDGANGFAGNLLATVTYTFNNDNEWRLDYRAETDQRTLYNPTNHVYFNLTGELDQSVASHELYLNSQQFAVIDDESLPTGELRDVTNTPFDFTVRAGKPLGQGFVGAYQQNKLVGGFDHPFLLTAPDLTTVQAELSESISGISLKMYTDSASVVIYTTNIGEDHLDMFGQTVGDHCGITLETQALPDAMNHQGFGSIMLEPGTVFTTSTIFKIAVK